MVNWDHTHDQQAAQIGNFLEFLWIICQPVASEIYIINH